jgi:transcriptional regulator with PAS, ATPase and Fis domain
MLMGQSELMTELRTRIARIAATSFTVLVEGESGAGKELVARELHARSPRHRGPFVALNCAAIVETLIETELFGIEERTATGVRGRRGKFELADEGTLFLDEVADLSPTAQAKLLRVLQDMSIERVGGQTPRRVDVRIVAATNRSLKALVQANLFRADLFYRLAGVELYVPPLRARREDIPLLVTHFLRVYGRVEDTLTPSATEALMTHDWPGNVRQLARVLERALALATGPMITVADLPSEITRDYRDLLYDMPERDDSLRAWSSRYVRLVLERAHGNKRRACDVLGISYHTLQSHLDYDGRTRRLHRQTAAVVPLPGGRRPPGPVSGPGPAWMKESIR